MAKPKTPARNLPHVICLMETSVDGKIMVDRWPSGDAAEHEYERLHDWHQADAWLCGRVTMAYFARTQRGAQPGRARLSPVANYADYVAGGSAKSYAVAADPAGKLTWKTNDVNGDRLIVLLTRRAPRSHLADLQSKNISYLVAGGRMLDFRSALAKLRARFGIKRLMVEGGGRINAAILHAGLIDELSLLVAPVIDGDSSTTSVFETGPAPRHWAACALSLLKVTRRPSGWLWLRYRIRR